MVKVKGSKNGDILKARFEGNSKSLFPNLNKTKAVVLLSIKGNQYCTGDYLSAIIEKATAEFGFTTFLIADEVYWHNLCRDIEPNPSTVNALKEEATLLGKTYFENHLDCFLKPLGLNSTEFDSHLIEAFPLDKQAALNRIATNYEVVFWRDWLNKSNEYLSLQSQITALYQSEPVLAESVQRVASDFVRRHAHESVSNDVLMQSSTNYLIEESPAVMWIAASLGVNFIVYPGEMIASFAASRDYFIRTEEEKSPLFVSISQPKLAVNWLEVSFIRSRSTDNSKPTKNKPSVSVDDHELTRLMRGVTEGIFSLDVEHNEKIRLITDIMLTYQKRKSMDLSEMLG
ncbi:hypothetical protein [Legionella birminghamensis]|uniref:hypothetical protein n=1 Tax=Legionella birminghamensis TaxID=28083 RepID=UPI001040F8C4|nr:hypothetical protein [Legionella birminghamensis]